MLFRFLKVLQVANSDYFSSNVVTRGRPRPDPGPTRFGPTPRANEGQGQGQQFD